MRYLFALLSLFTTLSAADCKAYRYPVYPPPCYNGIQRCCTPPDEDNGTCHLPYGCTAGDGCDWRCQRGGCWPYRVVSNNPRSFLNNGHPCGCTTCGYYGQGGCGNGECGGCSGGNCAYPYASCPNNGFDSPCTPGYNRCGCCPPVWRIYAAPRFSSISSGRDVTFVPQGNNQVEVIDFRRDATIWGAQGGIYYRRNGRPFEQLDAYWEQGRADKRDAAEQKRIWESYKVTGRLGFTIGWGCCCRFLWSPFIGYGYYYFQDEALELVVSSTETIPNRRFTYSTYFMPVGFLTTLSSGCFEAGLLIEYDIPTQSQLRVQSEGQVTGVGTRLRFQTGRRSNWLVEAPLRLFLGQCLQVDISLVPFFQQFRYTACEIIEIFPDETITAPARSVTSWGGRLEVGFSW